MLYSPASRVAFAHYPKTAGTSIARWFQGRFPDALPVEPSDHHLPVRVSLERIGLVATPVKRPKVVRECLRLVRQVTPRVFDPQDRCDTRIIGVVREPFAMLVSLFEYWWRRRFKEGPVPPLIGSARTGSFRTFLERAIGEGRLPNYHAFFDVDGPAWATTRLIAFESLGPGLAAVCRDFGIDPPTGLERCNVAPPGHRDIGAYMAEAGSLVFEVRRQFRWYYEEAGRVLVRGERDPHAKAA